MDKELIEDMKAHAAYVFREHKDSAMNIQAIQAYAALCKAEALERIADAIAEEDYEVGPCGSFHKLQANGLCANCFKSMDPMGKADQSIADAISERPILCLDCKERIPSAGVYAFNDPNEGQVIPLCGSCGRKRDKESIADAISEQVTDPPDVPFEPIRALCIGCDMLYPIEDLTTRSTGRFCTTCYYLEAV